MRVLIVEPDSGVRLGLELRLSAEPDLLVVGAAATEVLGIALCGGRAPDVMLVGDLLELDEATARLRAAMPDVPVVALSFADGATARTAAAAAGATSFVSKHDGDRALLDVLRRSVRLNRRARPQRPGSPSQG